MSAPSGSGKRVRIYEKFDATVSSLEESRMFGTGHSITMEVDGASDLGSSREGEAGDASPRVTVEPAPDSPDPSGKGSYERLMDILDLLELESEKLRRDVEKLADKKDELLTTLDALRTSDHFLDLPEDQQNKVLRYADRVFSNCGTVEVQVKTERDRAQEEALDQVNRLIDSLVTIQRSDPETSKMLCVGYMNACSPSMEEGVTDELFEMAILSCTSYDQKRILRRLQGLWDYFIQQ